MSPREYRLPLASQAARFGGMADRVLAVPIMTVRWRCRGLQGIKRMPAQSEPRLQPGFRIRPLYYLPPAVPLAAALHLLTPDEVRTCTASCIAIAPLAGIMGRATENLAESMGPNVGGLLNATFGNAAELIIAILALSSGKRDLVKASIT